MSRNFGSCHRSNSKRLLEKSAINRITSGRRLAGLQVGQKEHGSGVLQPGDSVEVFSHSLCRWVVAEVVGFSEDSKIRVEYEAQGFSYGKTLHPHSDDIVVPPACSPLVHTQIKDPVTVRLSKKGFTVRQLLQFYHSHSMHDARKTWQVVRDTVIPETRVDECCYMDGRFMASQGGPCRPSSLVSHWWGAEFGQTVVNIVYAATEQLNWDWTVPGESLHNIHRGYIRIPTINELEIRYPGSLDKRYWLCIFAINEHHAICGTSSNPCTCGAKKFLDNHELCEVNKFGDVMRLMDCLVVSLDRDLVTLSRVWCIAEIGMALQQGKDIKFNLAGFGLSNKCKHKLLAQGIASVLRNVEDCEATNESDRAMILSSIEADCGFARFNEMIFHAMIPFFLGVFAAAGKLLQVRDLTEQIVKKDSRIAMLNGRGVLFAPAWQGHAAVVHYLLSAQADANIPNEGGYSPLHASIFRNKLEVVNTLLAFKADLTCAVRHGTPLFYSAALGNARITEALLHSEADVNQTEGNEAGRTAAHAASYRLGDAAHEEVMSLLMCARADMNAIDKWGLVPSDATMISLPHVGTLKDTMATIRRVDDLYA